MLIRILRFSAFTLVLTAMIQGQPVNTNSDSAALSLFQAEQAFLRNNLQLLAARFNIDASRAAVVQAALWSNPNFAIEQNIYNQETGKYFDFTKSGNTEVQIQQLFLLAGKRDKQITMAQISAQMSENTFYDLFRSLKYELRTDFFDLYFLQKSIHFYDENIGSVRRTVDATETIYDKRSILLSEVLRLKSLLFTLQTERLGLVNRATEIENDLRVMLRDQRRITYLPQVSEHGLDSLSMLPLSLEYAVQTAKEHRPDLKNTEAAISYEQTNLALQKSLAIPDVMIGGRWSRAGSYIPDYFAVNMSIDLPFFNRNQGNILVSENTLEANKALRENSLLGVDKEMTIAFQKALETDRLYQSFDKKFAGQYEQLVDGTIASYQKRNISTIEFTDFFESYRASMLQLNQLQNDRIDAIENLNYVAGTSLIEYQ